MPSRPTALGCHIYAGGFTIGMARHFEIVGQLEEGPWGYDTFALNFPEVFHPLGRENWPIDQLAGRVNVMYANPPCAPWSAAGGRLGTADPRLQFTINSVKLALEIKPDFFVLESVCRAWTQGKLFYEGLFEPFKKMGYGVTALLTNSLLHGAPQSRERFHMIAHRYELTLKSPVFHLQDLFTIEQAIGDLERTARWMGEEPLLPNHVVLPPKPHELLVMAELKQGEGYNNVVDRLREQGVPDLRHWRMIGGRLNGRAVSSTLLDISAKVHHNQNRSLTLREGARLCTYPDDFVFAAEPKDRTYGAKGSDVTQAVIPLMGDYIGRLCMVSLENDIAKPGATEVVDYRPLGRQYTPGRFARRYLDEPKS